MKRTLFFAAVLAVGSAHPVGADMYQDASNAKLPEGYLNLSSTIKTCDGRYGSDGTMTAAGNTLTSATGAFTAADNGKLVSVRRAGSNYYANSFAISAGGAGHEVGELVTFPNGVIVYVVTETAGAVTKVYPVNRGSSATNPATIAQTGSVKNGSTLGAPTAGGTGLVLAPTWTRENLVTTIVSGSGTTATLAGAAGATVSGAVWGLGTDYGPEIQAAFDADQAVILPRGSCGHAQTLLPGNGDTILGKGIVATTLLYLGPTNQPQISVGADPGFRLTNAIVGNFTLDGLGASSKGLFLRGSTSGLFYDMLLTGHTTVGVDVHGNNTTDSIKNWFQRLDIAEYNAPYVDADSNAHGMWWGFPNTYVTNDHDLSHYQLVQTKMSPTAVGLICGVSDHNTMVYVQTRAGLTLTQPGIEMLGGNWAVDGGHCRNHHFVGMDAGDGGLKVRSTGWTNKPETIVDFYDRGNGGDEFSVEDGGILTVRDSNGLNDGLRLRGRPNFNLEPTPPAGTLHYQTNSPTRNPGSPISGGGTFGVPVFYDGTDWRVMASGRLKDTLSTAHASPTGTTSTTHVMMGLGSTAVLTPVVSGNVMVTLWGNVANSAAAGTARVRLQYGTGTAPANGDALTGTSACINSPQAQWLSTAAGGYAPFNLTCMVSGLTLDTAHWFDAAVASSAANTASISSATIQAAEQ